MSKSTVTNSKALKGLSVVGNLGSFDVLEANNLVISGETVSELVNGVQMVGISILDGAINNTIIGGNLPNQGFFTTLSSISDVSIYSIDKTKNILWDSINGALSITGNLSLQGCATLGNISICKNTISAINNNGDIYLIPNTLGSLYLNGPINNTTTLPGNYLTNLASGNVTFISSDYISLTSISSSSSITSFLNQTFTTINGDITLATETGLSSKTIKLISAVNSKIQVTTILSNNIKVGDNIILNNTNSIPKLDGTFLVTSIVNINSFTISTGNTFSLTSNSTAGVLLKVPSNNINLNAGAYVNIPTNIPLTLGSTFNSISGNTAGITLNTQKDLIFNIPGNLILNSDKIIIGTSGNEYINFDGITTTLFSTNINLTSTNTINLDGKSTSINTDKLLITDPNPILANYIQKETDLTDRGIQFKYYDNQISKLGWFGYKQSSSKFTLLVNATNNNGIFTGISGKFDIGDISTTSITLNSNSFINLNNGNLLNVNTITGNLGSLIVSNITRVSLLSTGDIYVPNNIPITFGTAGTFIKEGTTANLRLTAANNIFLSTATLGSIIIQPNIKLSFDGSSIGNQNIKSDTSGNLIINSTKNIIINSLNVTLPISSPIQFGNLTETILGNTSGMTITSNSFNLISNQNTSITNNTGNILLNSKNGDIQLITTTGNIRLLQSSRIVFGINNTTNSIRSNSNGNLSLYGPGNSILSGTIGNMIEFKNTSIINLTALSAINIPTNTNLNLDNNSSRFIVSDTNNNLFITNNNTTSSGIILTSQNTIINNNLNLNIINTNTNITTTNFIVSSTKINLNSQNVKILDPILTLANYNTIDSKDRGIEYNYTNTSENTKLGWFGYKNNLNQFTFFSDAINTNEVISGTLGQFLLGSAIIATNLSFSSQGNLNMNLGTISNLNTILNTSSSLNIISNQNININSISNGNVNISSNNINLITNKVLIPNTSLLSFGDTNVSLNSDTSGNLILNAKSTFVINSNVQINGTMNSVYSTTTVYQDPILSIGGIIGPTGNDLKDRGIEFKWSNGNISKTGFFGFQNSSNRFIFMADDINNNEVVTGSYGNVQFNNGFLNNLDLNCGTISSLAVLSGCNTLGLSLTSNTNINLSSSNIIIPNLSKLSFTNTNNNISSDTNGNLILLNNNNSIVLSSNILFNTNTNGNGYTEFNENSKVYFGSSTGNFLLRDTSGNFNITNSSGNINLNSNNIILPQNNNFIFGNSSSRITNSFGNLQLFGNTVSINSTSTITFNGSVNIAGSLSSVDSGKYIFPLGTKQQLTITNINYTTKILLTTSTVHYLTIGDTITLNNTNSVPSIDGIFTVSEIINNNTFSINSSIVLTTIGSSGIIYGVLKTYQGKDIGIEIDYWSTTGNTTFTSGSINYKQAFFGWINNTQQFTYYNNATIQNNVVTQGVLGDIKLNKLHTSKISGFTLEGNLIANSFVISTSNLQANGGFIDSIPIGSTVAQTGRFTSLTSNVSTTLENVNLTSNLNYSIERFILSSSLQTGNPSINIITTNITVNGVSFSSSGTMPNGTTDGQIKTISISSMGIGCQYVLLFSLNKLITPGTGTPTTLTFKSKGQSVQLIWDAILITWTIIGGNGAMVS